MAHNSQNYETAWREEFAHLGLGELWIGRSNAYKVAVTILAECEFLTERSSNIREKLLLSAYKSMNVSFDDGDKQVQQRVSLSKVANSIVTLVNNYDGCPYMKSTLLRNFKTIFPNYDPNNEQQQQDDTYDYYQLSRKEFHVPLGTASMKLLVKALRFYLHEAVASCYER